jgi:hypothetical protein
MCGTDGGGGCVREVSSQIPAKAGTTLRALACFKSGVEAGALFFGKGMVSKGMSGNSGMGGDV